MLLATSMVLSSVSVGTFADELIFEPEVSATTEAGEDEAYFGDDVVTGDEQNEEDNASDETFFADEVIDETVNDDVIAEDENIEDTANEVVDYAFEENADIFEAIENAEDTASDEISYDITGNMSYDKQYDGQPHGLDVTKSGKEASEVKFNHGASLTNPSWQSTSPTLTHVGSKAVDYQVYEYVGTEKEWNTYAGNSNSTINITPKSATATFKDKTFKVGDTVPTLTLADFTFDGLVSGETETQKFKLLQTSLTLDKDSVIAVQKWNGSSWDPAAYCPGEKGLGMVSGGKFAAAGRYLVRLYTEGYSATDLFEEQKLTGQTSNDYALTVEAGIYTVEEAEATKKEITVLWPDDLEYKAATPQTYEPVYAGYRFEKKEGTTNSATAVGKYVYTIGKVWDTKGTDSTTDDVDVTTTVTVTNPTHEWQITKGKAYAYVSASARTFMYGEKNPIAAYKASDIKLAPNKDRTGTEITETTTGTPVFETTYRQYDPVYDYSGDTRTAKIYTVRYASGLTMDNYDVYPAEDPETITSTTLGSFTLTPADVTVVPNNVTVAYGEPVVEPTYSLKDTTQGSGAAAVLQHDIDNGSVKLDVYTVKTAGTYAKVTPVDKNEYYYAATIADGTTGSHANTNFASTDNDNAHQMTVQADRKYVVTEGTYTLKFEDYEGVYDGKPHSIVVTPDPLPTGVTVYYSKKSIDTVEHAKQRLTATDDTKTQTSPITYVDPVETLVFYIVDSESLGSGLSGSNKVTIKSVDEVAADKVEKQIEEAVKPDAAGNLDADKIAEARKAYDALTDAQKAKVDPYDVKALKDAEEKVKEQTDDKAAKAVEELIDKLPAADKATAADKEAADAAKDAYDNLTDAQKKLVPADKVKKMDDVKAAADKAAEDADKKAAKAVEEEIAALPAAADAKASDKAAADKAKADYDALTDAQKALVPAEAVEKMNAVKAAADKAAEEDEKAEKERELFDEAVALVKAQKNGVDGKNAADNAKQAYDNLSDAAKAKLTDEEIEAYENTQKAYARNYTFNSGEGVFKVLGNGEVTYFKPLHPENTWFVVPNMVKKNGFSYKVIKVSTKAFMGCINATKIKIGKNVQVIGEYAFKNTPAMTKLIMLTSKLASGKVQNSFVAGGKDKGAKLTNYVPSGKSSAYDSLFKGEGGMNAKAKFTENN